MVDVEALSMDVKIGQMIMAGFPSKYYDAQVKELIESGKIGNVILFSRNIGSRDEIVKLTRELQRNFLSINGIGGFIAIDQEGGMVTRIFKEATYFPGNMAFAAANISGSTFKQGRIEGEELRALGINMNLAPVLDVNCNPKNPIIGSRSYGDDPYKVSELGVDLIKGLRHGGIAGAAKHFPGHGDTEVDSHIGLPIIKHNMDRLEKIELLPFKKAIEDGVEIIMTAHVLFPEIEQEKIPATLSKKILSGLLRGKLGYEGLIITDCMEMKAIADYYGSEKAAVMAIKAGADLICISHHAAIQMGCIAAIREAVEKGEISEERINASVRRILEVKQKYSVEKISDNRIFESGEGRNFAESISDKSITLLKDELKLLPVKGRVVCISTKAESLTGADEHIDCKQAFCQRVAEEFKGIGFEMTVNPDEKFIKQMVEECRKAERVVIGTYNAAAHSGQLRLVKEISEINKNIIVVSLRNPYDLLNFQNLSTYINAYDYSELSVNSVLKVLSGKVKSQGVSPIKLC